MFRKWKPAIVWRVKVRNAEMVKSADKSVKTLK